MVKRLTEWNRNMPLWLRCVAGAVLLYLLYYASTWVLAPFGVPFPWTVLPSMLGALVVGVHIRSWWWVATPLLAVSLFWMLPLLFLGAMLWSAQYVDRRLVGEIALTTVAFGAGIGLLHALPALIGVWWGKRRSAADVGPSESNPA